MNWDIDGSGYLDKPKFQKMLEIFSIGLSDGEMNVLLNSVATSPRGLSLSDFVSLVHGKPVRLKLHTHESVLPAPAPKATACDRAMLLLNSKKESFEDRCKEIDKRGTGVLTFKSVRDIL